MATDVSIAVVGMGGVGKSALVIRYLKDEFHEEYNPTIEECFRKKITLDGKRIKVEIYDTAGQREFSTFRDSILDQAKGYMVVYSIDNAKSFQEAKDLVMRKLIDAGKPICLVGNKLDLPGRQVTTEEAKQFCTEHRLLHGECSAKNREDSLTVAKQFESLLRLVVSQKSMDGSDKCVVS